MSKLVVSAGQTGIIPSRMLHNVLVRRHAVILHLVSGDAWIGWSDTVTSDGGEDAGIPLPSGVAFSMASSGLEFSKPLRVFSIAGCVVNYQELLLP